MEREIPEAPPTRRRQVIRALGMLAGKVRQYPGESRPAIREIARPLPELTTPSLEALQLYTGGRRPWQAGQSARAVGLFQAALAHAPGCAMVHASRSNLAHAYHRPRDNHRAAECYQQFIAMSRRAMGWEAQQSWFAAHLRLAEAYLAMGERGKAAAPVSGLAAPWVNADPELPLVRALRQLRARIGGGD